MLDPQTARSRLDPKLSNQEFLLWLLAFDNLTRGHAPAGSTTTFTRVLLRVAFMYGHEHRRLLASKTDPKKRNQAALCDAVAQKMVQTWLAAANRCEIHRLKQVTFTSAELGLLRDGYAYLADAADLLTTGAYIEAQRQVRAIMEGVQ